MEAAMKSVVETVLLSKMLPLLKRVETATNGKWSAYLGHPLSQYAFHVSPAATILSRRVSVFHVGELGHPDNVLQYESDTPCVDPELRAT